MNRLRFENLAAVEKEHLNDEMLVDKYFDPVDSSTAGTSACTNWQQS